METASAILIGAALATAGWLYTGRRARTLARKQHTINVMVQANFNTEFIKNRNIVAPFLKSCQFPNDALEGNNEELREAFRDYLNHYEFFSAGLRNGDFDERLTKDSERGTFVTLFSCCEQYIYSLRTDRERMTIYENLEWIYQRWEKYPPGRIRKFAEYSFGRPFRGKIRSSDGQL